MSRKIKVDSATKATRKNISVHSSLSGYVQDSVGKPFSKYIQEKICEDITGMTFTEFTSLVYPLHSTVEARYHSSDTLHKEYYRVARWMCEGEIMDVQSQPLISAFDLQVKWKVSGVITWVRVDYSKGGFKHVLYDTVLEGKSGIVPSKNIVAFDKTVDAKMKLIDKWIKVSKSLEGNA